MIRKYLFMVPLLLPMPALAGGWPGQARVLGDLQSFWKKSRPQEKLALVKSGGECLPVAADQVPVVKGKKARGQVCVVSADLYLEQGFRFQVWRESKVYYANRALWWVEPGRLDWAWREGGVPPPSPEQAEALIKEALARELGSGELKLSLVEAGQPHSQGEYYRLTVVVNLEAGGRRLENFPVFLLSDGGDWRVAEGLNRLPPQK
jgi:hypothetical protein